MALVTLAYIVAGTILARASLLIDPTKPPFVCEAPLALG